MSDECSGTAGVRSATFIAKRCRECDGQMNPGKLRRRRIAFVCVGNTCRSQMAEALAGKLGSGPDTEFVSMGTDPGQEMDSKALEVLREENIIWLGRPKGIQDKEPLDVVVTMGCEVGCPVVPAAHRVEWDIPDPWGKDTEDYRKTLGVIKEKIAELLKEIDRWPK